MPYVYQEFPKWVHHKHSTPVRLIERTVASAEEQAALGPDWIDVKTALKLAAAPAVPGDSPTAQADSPPLPADLFPVLQHLLTEIRAVADAAMPLSAFYDAHGSTLIGGPADPTEFRRRAQRIDELIEQLAVAGRVVPPGPRALAGGREALRQFALDLHYQCVQALSDLPGCPVRVDRVCEVLEAWCRHLMTRAAAGIAAGLATRQDLPPIDPSRPYTRAEAAKRLGVSVDTLDRMRADGEITGFQVRRQWRVLASEVHRVKQKNLKYKDR